MRPTCSFITTLERKDPRLPVYFVVPAARMADWGLAGTVVVEGRVNGTSLGRRTLKKWDADRWFVELAAPLCKAADLKQGDKLNVELVLADEGPPEELQAVLEAQPDLARRWSQVPRAQARAAMEHVRAGKSPSTRTRRAEALAARLRAPS
jgi:hypothetical protein